MDTTTTWNSIEVAKLLVSILTPIVIVILGFVFNSRLQKLEKEKEDRRRKEEIKEQKERDELERRYTPHIEFDIGCNFFGPYQGKYAAEFVITANNKGITKHKFKNITLRIRGIKQKNPFSFWVKKYKHRLEFPEKILEDEVSPVKWGTIWVEPGVKQHVSYMTIIDEEFKFITAWAGFKYEKYSTHTTEKMFEVGRLTG